MRSLGVHLVRHYPYVRNPDSEEFKDLVLKLNRGLRLTEWEKARMDELDKTIKHVKRFSQLPKRVRRSIQEIMQNPENTLLCYDPQGNRREIDTANDLTRTFKIPEKNLEPINIPPLRDQDDFWFIAKFRQSIIAILARAEQMENINNVVLVGRRSYSYAFSRFSDNPGGVLWRRLEIERSGALSCYMRNSPKIADVYDFLKSIESARSRRNAEKILRGRDVLLNGVPTVNLRETILLGDRIEYRGQVFIISVNKFWVLDIQSL